jgi:membrane protein implicated in regulation of membrane protease activity
MGQLPPTVWVAIAVAALVVCALFAFGLLVLLPLVAVASSLVWWTARRRRDRSPPPPLDVPPA